MGNKKISELSGTTSPSLGALTVVVESGETLNTTLQTLRNLLVDSGSHYFTGSQNINGNLIISGSLTAQEYILSSSISNMIIESISGSTAFGNSLDDTHNFTGSLNITGSLGISGSINIEAEPAGIGYINSLRFLAYSTNSPVEMYQDATGFEITSANGQTITLGNPNLNIAVPSGNDILLDQDGNRQIKLTDDRIEIGNYTDDTTIIIYNNTGTVEITGSVNITSGLTVNGNLDINGYTSLQTISSSLNFNDDTEAASAGVPLGGLYRSGSFVLIRLN